MPRHVVFGYYENSTQHLETQHLLDSCIHGTGYHMSIILLFNYGIPVYGEYNCEAFDKQL